MYLLGCVYNMNILSKPDYTNYQRLIILFHTVAIDILRHARGNGSLLVHFGRLRGISTRITLIK